MTYLTQTDALPDPHVAPEFYTGILMKRGLAWILDLFLITILTLVAGVLTLSLGFFLWPLFFVGIGFIYRIATLVNGSATPGMRLLGIELRDTTGARLDPATSVLHVCGYYASVAFVLPALATIGAMMVTGKRQSLTDLILGTAALNRPG